MPETVKRAVRLIAVGEEVKAEQMSREQVAAYSAVDKAARIQSNQINRRNSALEAAARLYAHANFR